MVISESKFILIGALIAAAGLLYLVKKKGAAQSVGQAVGGAVADAAIGVTEGVVFGIGDKAGLPRTDQTECQKAIAEGSTWDSSFVCPASDFISSINPFK